jgi:hypothetical protein
MCRVSNHAVLRYQERVERISATLVRERIKLSSAFIDKAAAFGCDTVILGDGVRLKLAGNTVATVLEKRVR